MLFCRKMIFLTCYIMNFAVSFCIRLPLIPILDAAIWKSSIANNLETFTCWSAFVSDLKTKNQTYTAISRHLLHAFLGIDAEQLAAAKSYHYAPYARILGFRKDASPLLKELQAHSQIPLLRKIAKEKQTLTPQQQNLLDLDVYATDLYNRMLFSKTGTNEKMNIVSL